MGRWKRRVRAVGTSLVGVLQAELHAMLEDFQHTGRGAVRGLALLGAAAVLAFWSFGVLTAFAVALLAIWLTVWQAAALVFVLLVAAGGVVGGIGWRILKRLKMPGEIVRTHVDDHLLWWRETLSEPSGELGEGSRRTGRERR